MAADSKPTPTSWTVGGVTSEQAIRQALSDAAAFDFQGTPLVDVMDYLGDKHHLQVKFDRGALKEVGIDPKTALVTFSTKDVSLRSALRLMLAPLGLAAIVKDEVLLVTSKAKAEATYVTRLYDVHDLILNPYDPGEAPDFDAIIDAIQKTVSPSTWDKAGGQGTVAQFNSNGICALLVWQNEQGHEQVENLLKELRNIQPRRVYNQ
jgi:hypothetical protein